MQCINEYSIVVVALSLLLLLSDLIFFKHNEGAKNISQLLSKNQKNREKAKEGTCVRKVNAWGPRGRAFTLRSVLRPVNFSQPVPGTLPGKKKKTKTHKKIKGKIKQLLKENEIRIQILKYAKIPALRGFHLRLRFLSLLSLSLLVLFFCF
jgi:hypothetical protein